MKPILFESNLTSFAGNGIGVLSDAASCIVTEERNGAFELEMGYPISGIHYAQIVPQRIILAKPNPVEDPQPFRIYRISRPMRGVVMVYAQHISYDLSGIPVTAFSAGSAAAALAQLSTRSVVDNPFTFWTDLNAAGTFTVEMPASIRSLLGGTEGSILDVYGGEYAFDGHMVRLYAQRGTDRGASIRYGKNLTSLEQEENCASVYTGVLPYWTDGEGGSTVGGVVRAEGSYPLERILPLDLTQDFEEKPSAAQLEAEAESYIKRNDIGVPTVSLTVSFVQLEQTEEYAHLALLERVSLCDLVTVSFPALGVEAKAKCVKTVFDVLKNRYTSVEIGDAKTNIADTIAVQAQQMKDYPSVLQKEVDRATALITGNMGGYVILHSSTGGKKPDEILIMDTEDIATATKVWRFNKAGLGYSSTGYNGPYGLAMTQDGAIVADFITAGSMTASIVKTGVLQSVSGRFTIDLSANTITMRNSAGKVVFSFDGNGDLSITGKLNAATGTFAGELQAAKGTFAGELVAVSGSFTRLTAANASFTPEKIVLQAGGASGSLVIGDASAEGYGEVAIYNPNAGSIEYDDYGEGNLGTGDHAWDQVISEKIYARRIYYYEACTEVSSSEKTKKRIESLTEDFYTDFDAFRPVSFLYKNDKKEVPHVGMIAEEVAKICPAAIFTTDDGIQTINQNALTMACFLEIQQLRKRVTALEERMRA